jgi:hypothetical protein
VSLKRVTILADSWRLTDSAPEILESMCKRFNFFSGNLRTRQHRDCPRRSEPRSKEHFVRYAMIEAEKVRTRRHFFV